MSTCFANQAKHVHFVLYIKVLLLYGIPSHTVKALLRIKNICGSQTRPKLHYNLFLLPNTINKNKPTHVFNMNDKLMSQKCTPDIATA